jgi:cyclic beta-1,2-glucan synthetase
VRVVRTKAAKTVSLEVNGAKVKGNAFEPKGGSDVVVKIPA